MDNKKQYLIDIIEDTQEDQLEDREFGIYDTFDQSDCLDVGNEEEIVDQNKFQKYSNITNLKAINCNKLFDQVRNSQDYSSTIKQSKSQTIIEYIKPLSNKENQENNNAQDQGSNRPSFCNQSMNIKNYQFDFLLGDSIHLYHDNNNDYKLNKIGLKHLAKIGSLKNTYKSYNNINNNDIKHNKEIYNNTQGLEFYLNSFINHQEKDTQQMNKNKNKSSKLQQYVKPERIKTHFRTGSTTTFQNSPQFKDYQKDRKNHYKMAYERISQDRHNDSSIGMGLRHSFQSQQELTLRLISHKDKVKQKIQLLQDEQEDFQMKECTFTPHFMTSTQTCLNQNKTIINSEKERLNSKTQYSSKMNYHTVQNSPTNRQLQINDQSKLNISSLNQLNQAFGFQNNTVINSTYQHQHESSSITRRSPKQFYDDQLNYQEKTFKKLLFKFQEQLIQEKQELDNVKLVCQGSERIVAQRRACSSMSPKSVYERLYKLEEKQYKTKRLRDELTPECTFRPQILSNQGLVDRDNQKVEDILYRDALRRQHVRQISAEIKSQHYDYQQQIGNIVIPQSEKYLQQPLERDYNAAIMQIFGQIKNIELLQLDFRQIEEILELLGFIQDNSDRIELFKLWEYLGFKEKQRNQTVYADKLFNLLLNILNIRGQTDYKECRKVHYKFQRFFKNREKYLKSLKSVYKKNEVQQILRNPHINKKSREIDDSVNQAQDNKSRPDILIEKGKEYQKRRDQQSIERISQEIQMCTFTPQINPNKHKTDQKKEQNKNILMPLQDISFNVSKLSSLNNSIVSKPQVPLKNKEHHNQTSQSIKDVQQNYKKTRYIKTTKQQHQKDITKSKCITNKENYSNNNISQQKNNTVTSKQMIKNCNNPNILRDHLNYKNTINRNQQSQINEEQSKQILQYQELDAIPLVYLDVHINKDQIDRVILYKGQNADDAIQRFAMKNNLTNTDIEIIKNALKAQVPDAFDY